MIEYVIRDDSCTRMLAWLAREGVDVSRVKIAWRGDGERATYATAPIRAGEVLFRIPRRLLVTSRLVEESPIGRLLDGGRAPLRSSHSRLAAYLLAERRDPDSPWRSYLDALPRDLNHLAIHFGERELELLHGSSLPSRIRAMRASIDRDRAVVARSIPALADVTREEFTWARLAVMSRVFGVRLREGRAHALIPLADMLNHDSDSETRCGFSARHDEFFVRAKRDCAEGEELRGDYGRRCNGRMLLGYGFCQDENDENEAELAFPAPRGGTRRFSVRACFDDAEPVLSFLRAACATARERAMSVDGQPIGTRNERAAMATLAAAARAALARYPTTIEEDDALLDGAASSGGGLSRTEVSCIQFRRGEKSVLRAYLDLALFALPFLRLSRAELARAVREYAPVGTFAGDYLAELASRT